MKKIKFMLFAVAAMAAVSCAKEIDAPENQNQVQVNYVDMEFTAVMEPLTRTSLSDGNKVVWKQNESLTVLDNSPTATTHANQFTATSATSNPLLTGTVPDDATEFYAFYPWRSQAVLNGTTIEGGYLNPSQTPKKNSFNDNCGVMMAKADAENNFSFKNVLSHIVFTIPEDMTDVKSLTLMGNNDEIIAGTFNVDWNNGDPKVIPVIGNSSDSYVILKYSNGNALTPGDYYFSFFPTEFKNGFTIIISKTDGTQVARTNPNPVSSVASRNKILPLAEVPSTGFAEHMNYWVRYVDGFDINISGYTLNNTTHPSAKYVADTKNNTDITAAGYYFVSPNCTKAKFSAHKTYKNMIVLGADAGKRSTFVVGGNQGLVNDGTIYMLANLDATYTKPASGSYQILRTHGDGTEENPATFGTIVVNNCHFRNIPGNFIHLEGTAKPLHLQKAVIEDCDLGFAVASVYLFNKASSNSIIESIELKNNVIYASSGTTMTDFRLINLYNNNKVKDENGQLTGETYQTGSTVNYCSVTNNTLVGTTSSSGLIRVMKMPGEYIFRYNLIDAHMNKKWFPILDCYATVETESETNGVIYPSSGRCTDNYCHTAKYNDNGTMIDPTVQPPGKYFSGIPAANAVLLSASPLSALWEPENGKFGAYTITPVDPSKAPAAGVLIGAQRSDMTEESANVDSPSADYNSTDLGAL